MPVAGMSKGALVAHGDVDTVAIKMAHGMYEDDRTVLPDKLSPDFAAYNSVLHAIAAAANAMCAFILNCGEFQLRR